MIITEDRNQNFKTNNKRIANSLMVFVGISGCFSVLFGAWLSHGSLSLSINQQSSLEIAQQYQFIHTVALLACLIWLKSINYSKILITACFCFLLGIVCFSGVIYVKTFFDLTLIGQLTPFGGLAYALAWVMVAIEGLKKL